jgi:molybdenum cofactor synthesis domain-containing protein
VIDLSDQPLMSFTARAEATMSVRPPTVELVKAGKLPGGDPLPAASAAAQQGAKHAAQILPNAHSSLVEYVGCDLKIGPRELTLEVVVKAIAKSPISAEALMAASAAAVSLVQSLREVDTSAMIEKVALLESSGGRRRPDFQFPRPLRAAVVVLSDSRAAGKDRDESGPIAKTRLEKEGFQVVDYVVLPDDAGAIEARFLKYADEQSLDLVVSSGGTGLGPRDVVPEITSKIIDKEILGVSEAIRAYGQSRTTLAMLSRATCGLRKQTVFLNLPGAPAAVRESLEAAFPELLHLFKMMKGGGHEKKA